MGKIALLAFSFFLLPSLASAYIPPSFYIYTHLAEQRSKSPAPAVVISVSRPTGSGTEEVIGSVTYSNWQPKEEGWPALSLLFSNNADSLIAAVNSFGIPVTPESALLRASKDQIAAMKDPPNPFYKSDKQMSLKRYRQAFSWVHGEGERSIWIEKDSFVPLKIEGPCPDQVKNLSWVKSGKNKCELEFRNVLPLMRGNPQGSRITVWKDGNPALYLSFDRVIPARAGTTLPATDIKVAPEVAAAIDSILH